MTALGERESNRAYTIEVSGASKAQYPTSLLLQVCQTLWLIPERLIPRLTAVAFVKTISLRPANDSYDSFMLPMEPVCRM